MNHPRNHDRTAFAAYAAVASHGKRLKAEMDGSTTASKTDLLSVEKEFPPSEDVIMYLAARTMVEQHPVAHKRVTFYDLDSLALRSTQWEG